MSQETINLLVGALIGIVSSLLSQIVSNYYQNRRDIRARNWELEDRRANRILEVKNQNIQGAREYVRAYNDALQKIDSIGNALIHTKDVEGSKTGLEQILALQDLAAGKEANIRALGSEELIDLSHILSEVYENGYRGLNALRTALLEDPNATMDFDNISASMAYFRRRSERYAIQIHEIIDRIALELPPTRKSE